MAASLHRSISLLLSVVAILVLTASGSATSLRAIHEPVSNITTDAVTIAASFCELCRDQRQCERAYHGGPGVVCGAILQASQRPACCCPSTDRCRTSGEACECVAPVSSLPTKVPRIGVFSSHKIAWTVVGMGVLSALFATYWYTTRLDRHYHYHYYEPSRPQTQNPHAAAYRPPQIQADTAEAHASKS